MQEEEELIKKTLERQTASVPSTSNVLPIKPTKPAGGGGNQPKSKQASLISVGVRKRYVLKLSKRFIEEVLGHLNRNQVPTMTDKVDEILSQRK